MNINMVSDKNIQHNRQLLLWLIELLIPLTRVILLFRCSLHDLKKAFDTVDHPTLLRKLHAYGIRGSAFNWLKSYLSERSQYVVYDSKRSETKTVKCGVPQGSILGPLLFLIYMNDICNASQLLFSIMYAHDTSVQLSGNYLIHLVRSLNAEL